MRPLTIVQVTESCISAHRYSKSFVQNDENTTAPGQKPGSAERSDNQSVSVILDIDKRESWTTAITPGTWTRIITNLLGNAMKYTPAGVVSITLSTDTGNADSSDEDETFVQLRIEDTGIGMSKKFINSGLFTPFKQADGHSIGTGLGLSIVKGIAKEIGAFVSVESQVGKGTSVLVRFKADFVRPQDTGSVDFGVPPMISSGVFCMLNNDDSQ